MNYYNQIKEELINNEIYKKVKDYSKNRNDLTTYYNVGKILSEAGKHYGEGIIKKYSEKLIIDVGRKYNERTLRRIRQFYLIFSVGKRSPLATNLSWSHFQELLSIKNKNERDYYIKITEEQTLSKRELREKIKNKEYERLPEDTKLKLMKNEDSMIKGFIKNPIILKNKYDMEEISEKMLKQLILEDIDNFLKELGDGFSYIGNEYKIKLGERYNFIDLLLFNYIYNCFIVIELKVTELKAEYIGQIQKYMDYIDKNVKRVEQNETIGIIIVKKDNKFIMEYCSVIESLELPIY